jgi:NTE family protein
VARGLVHIGVLQILKEENINIDIIAGTSIGAIIGAMFSENLDPYEIESRFKDIIESELYKDIGFPRLSKSDKREASFWDQIYSKFKGTITLTLAQTKISILDDVRFRKVLDQLIKIEDFKECKIPLMVVATDLLRGRDVPLCVGNLKEAVMASASIPGFFPPVSYGEYLLSDGAIACPVPVKYVALSENFLTLSVAVPPKVKRLDRIENAIELLIRAEEINMYHLTSEMIKKADVPIMPDTKGIEWNEFHYIDELIKIGRESAKQIIPQIKKHLGLTKLFFFKGFGLK